jgi:hypothetical protein
LQILILEEKEMQKMLKKNRRVKDASPKTPEEAIQAYLKKVLKKAAG